MIFGRAFFTTVFVSILLGAQAYAAPNACNAAFAARNKAALDRAHISRETNFERLKNEEFDVLVIGGGSAGLGTAVDAASRGLKVALVEANDFAAETSSRSTKLLHGGVRYLEQLVMTFLKTLKFDKVMYNLIRDALHERNTALKLAPHLTRPLPIVTPIYKAHEVPYYWAGLKAYDALAGRSSRLPRSGFVDAATLKRDFPLMKQQGLKGGVLYYDGQFNDSRMAVALAMTAQEAGVAIVNHARVVGLTKSGDKLNGASVQDGLSGASAQVRAKVVINATGPFSDRIRRMDDPNVKPMIAAAARTHIVLSKKFVPPSTGMLIPKTDDGRVLFVLPWEGHTLVGTTDARADVKENPKATEADIEYILGQVAKYYETKPTREDVLSHWAGIRPLVSDPKSADTAKLARDHVVQVSESNLLTVAGGKWTTYRKMALDVVDQAIRVAGLKPTKQESGTEDLVLIGGRNYSPDLAKKLEASTETDIAAHLAHNYGDRATEILELARTENLGKRLAEAHPFLEAEVLYAIRAEGARTTADIISRRIRLTFLEHAATRQALDRVIDLAGNELNWSSERRATERDSILRDLATE